MWDTFISLYKTRINTIPSGVPIYASLEFRIPEYSELMRNEIQEDSGGKYVINQTAQH